MDSRHPKTLLILVASNRRRGAEVFGEHLAMGLPKLGWDVDFAALQSVSTDRTVSATPLSAGEGLGRLDLSTVRSLRQRIKTRRPAIILANGGATLRYAIAANATLVNRPRLAYASIGEPRYWLRSEKHARLQRFLHGRPNVVLAVSKMTKMQLVEDLRVDSSRVHVAATGVGKEYFVEPDSPHSELRILYLGSLSEEKDPMTALDVLVDLRQEHDARLRMVGDGPLADSIRQRIRDDSIENAVELTGPVDDVTQHLRWADVLILTSKTEGLPGAALEAGAASIPVVAFNVGGTSETMIDGTSGVIVDSGDTEAMVQALAGLAGDRPSLDVMGKAGRQLVEDHFTLDIALARYDAILTATVEEARPR